MEPLHTADLVLRDWRDADIDSLVGLFADPSFSWHPYRRARDADEARVFLAATRAHIARHGIGRWAVCARASGALVGYAGVTAPSWPDRPDAWELGFRLAAPARGRGWGRQAGRAVIEAAFRVGGRSALVSTTEADHLACRRLLAALGLRETARLPHPVHRTPHIVAEVDRDDRRSAMLDELDQL